MPDTPIAAPPVAAVKPIDRTHHGDTFVDDYEWLRDKTDPEVISYLEAENAYTTAGTAHLESLRETVFAEISTRTKQTDLSVPVRHGRHWYYTRTVEGQQYAIHCRVTATGDQPPEVADAGVPGEEVMLDGNVVAGDSDFFCLGTVDVSPDGRLLAYSVDLTGEERFTLRFRDLATGADLADEVTGIFYGSAWSTDASVVFYVTVDDAWRPDKVWRHTLGDTGDDVVVFAEPDERFWLGVGLSRNEQVIEIHIGSKLTSEVWFVDAAQPLSDPTVVDPRREGVEYDVEHAGDRLLVVHNDGAENFALAWAPLDAPGHEHWTEILPGSAERRLLGVDAFAGHAVLHQRIAGLSEIAVLRRIDDGFDAPELVEFDEPIYTVNPGSNPEWNADHYRFSFTSMVTPASVFDLEVATGERALRKQQPVLGDVDLSAYTQYREWATASDGTKIPLSLVARADVARDGNAPVVLYGYGSYEISVDPSFSIPRLSLLDRGVVFVIAHIRGGGEMGRPWYDGGKMLTKRNTFTDFVASAEHLVQAGWARPERIVAEGGSAGGLLMGAVANLAPTAFGGVTAVVPFVDALTTILDPSLPLTVTEWEEWGNPLADPEVYAYMKSYAPYENVTATRYPRILAITSLNDTRVFFVEPAKWVARLRATAVDPTVLLKTEMDAGHGGRSGRYDAWRETAFKLAWQLDVLGLA